MPTGREVYDALMSAIEPELVTANLSHLDDRYANEAANDRAKRYQRYAQAYAAYDKAFQKWMNAFTQEVTTFRRTAMQSAEQQSREEEGGIFTSLDEELSASSD